MSTIVKDLVELLINKNITIATCESITAGKIASSLVDIPNASKTFLGGLVTYSAKSKIEIAKVNEKTISKYGTISRETAIEMAENVTKKFKADIGVSITGNAGPTSDENKPVGLAYIGICIVDKTTVYELRSNQLERNDIRIDLTFQVISLLYRLVSQLKC